MDVHMRILSFADSAKANHSPSKGNQGKYHIGEEWIKTDYLGYEGAAEYLCSELLSGSNVLHTSYHLEQVKIETKNGLYRTVNTSVSKNFLPEGAEAVTLDKLLKKHLGTTFEAAVKGKPVKEAIAYIVGIVEKLTGIKDFGPYLTKMLEFDTLVLNEDRHAQNIQFLLQNGKYSCAPVFDNGAAFLSDITQEYPLTENTKQLTGFVQAKPFSTSFSEQVTACQELYGKQLTIEHKDLSIPLSHIKSVYGEKIADRMKYIYDLQIRKYKDLLQIKEPEALYTEEEMRKELLSYAESGGSMAYKLTPQKFVEPLKVALLEAEIPFVTIPGDEGVTICTKDLDGREFLKIQAKVFEEGKPPIIPPNTEKLNAKEATQALQIAEYDDV